MDDTRDAETKGSPDLGKESSDLGKGSPDLGKGSTDLGRESSSYIRLPWPLVAAGLFGFLGVALAVGLFANRNLRPQVGPIATPIAVVAPTTPQLPTATLQPAFAQPPTTQPAAVTTPTPLGPATDARPTATIPRATAAPVTTVLATSATPSARPTLDPLLVAQVGEAYDQYWQVRSHALLKLDKTYLPEVMGGEHLKSIVQLIDELHVENRAIKTDVDHEFQVLQISDDSAQLFDDYISNSIYVDASTEQPLSEPSSDELRVLYRFARSDGKWKVVDSVRAE